MSVFGLARGVEIRDVDQDLRPQVLRLAAENVHLVDTVHLGEVSLVAAAEAGVERGQPVGQVQQRVLAQVGVAEVGHEGRHPHPGLQQVAVLASQLPTNISNQ